MGDAGVGEHPEPGQNRLLAGLAAKADRDRLCALQAGTGRLEQGDIIRVDDGNDLRRPRPGEEGAKRMADHRLASDSPVLLGPLDRGAGALAAPGGDDDGPNCGLGALLHCSVRP